MFAFYIIEDDAPVADALRGLLQGPDTAVHIFGDAESFLETAAVDPGDVVIVDLGLPGISGIDLLGRLDGFVPDARLIAISGQAGRDFDRLTRDLPVERILRKPPTAEWFSVLVS